MGAAVIRTWLFYACKWRLTNASDDNAFDWLCYPVRPTMIWHYIDVTMGPMVSQITSLGIVYSTVYSGADERKHQSSASLAFVRRIHRGPVNSPHKRPVTRRMFSFDDVIMICTLKAWQMCFVRWINDPCNADPRQSFIQFLCNRDLAKCKNTDSILNCNLALSCEWHLWESSIFVDQYMKQKRSFYNWLKIYHWFI